MRLNSLILSASLAVLTSSEGFIPRPALIIVNIQDCFMENGSLPVKGTEDLIPVINKIRTLYENEFKLVALALDWHCPHHVSFASTNPGYGESDILELKYVKGTGQLCINGSVTQDNYPDAIDCTSLETFNRSQVLWPDHCIENVNSGPTSSAIPTGLITRPSDVIIKKGNNCDVESYSAFYDATHTSHTGLDDELKKADVNVVFIVGLVLDYCVNDAAFDALELGYKAYVVIDATKSIAADSTPAVKELLDGGVHVILSDEIGAILQELRLNSS